jgi:hypothetical protein
VLLSVTGLVALTRSNYEANAASEMTNNLNRTLTFLSDTIRRAIYVTRSENEIDRSSIPESERDNARPVLGIRIPNPRRTDEPIPRQIVVYLVPANNGTLTLRIVAPTLDDSGNFANPEQTGDWMPSTLLTGISLSAPEDLRDCDPFRQGTGTAWVRIPRDDNNLSGLHTRIKQDLVGIVATLVRTDDRGNQIYSNRRAVFATRTAQPSYSPITSTGPILANRLNPGANPLYFDNPAPNRIILTEDATVTATLLPYTGGTEPSCPRAGCFIDVYDDTSSDTTARDLEINKGVVLLGSANQEIVVSVDNITSDLGTITDDKGQVLYQESRIYTSKDTLPAGYPNVTLTTNQLLFAMRNPLGTNKTYLILVDIAPRNASVSTVR